MQVKQRACRKNFLTQNSNGFYMRFDFNPLLSYFCEGSYWLCVDGGGKETLRFTFQLSELANIVNKILKSKVSRKYDGMLLKFIYLFLHA